MLNSSTVATLPELNWMKEKFGPNLDTFDAGYLKSGYLKASPHCTGPRSTSLWSLCSSSYCFHNSEARICVESKTIYPKQEKKQTPSILRYFFSLITNSHSLLCLVWKYVQTVWWEILDLMGARRLRRSKHHWSTTAASYIFNANRIEAFHSPCSIMMVGVVGFLAHFQDSEFFIITAVIRHSNYIFSKDWVRLTFCQF